MRLIQSDPDIETIVRRIDDGGIDLQPNYQRGEVWSISNKQRLIDSVLRDWHVPPVHFVVNENNGDEEVLDGQQRLVSIRDFVHGKFVVNGNTDPYDENIRSLNGLKYEELPPHIRRKFDRFSIRVYKLVDYTAEEPGELFFRLNNQSMLNPAEQRNAFYGLARSQVKDIVGRFDKMGLNAYTLGFSNSRMSYEDIVARICVTVQSGSLEYKITANSLEKAYRSQDGFDTSTVEIVHAATEKLGLACANMEMPVRFNKATVHSWLLFVIRDMFNGDDYSDSMHLGGLIYNFEYVRQLVRRGATDSDYVKYFVLNSPVGSVDIIYTLLSIFNDRSTARVSDVNSVILRDSIMWMMAYNFSSILYSKTFMREKNLNSVKYLWNNVNNNAEYVSYDFSKEKHVGEVIGLEEVLLDSARFIEWERLS